MRVASELVIDPRFRGPDASANGGYACGRIAAAAGGEVAVTLRSPPPLGVPLRVEAGRVLHGETLVAEFGPAAVELEPPEPPTFDEAVEAQRPDVDSLFPHCFVCGVRRAPDDGLHIHPGPVGSRGLVAAPWVPRPDTSAPEFVWCALDCPGAYASGLTSRGALLLGRLAARVLRTPQPGERCVVAGWPLGGRGRAHEAGTALWAGGELLGLARATWIEPRG
ncbi:MAG TPA: hypothetical protein VFB42_02825 [Gaiellaceae bacterium]|nr:hypothetical protein [Gaiellaceae bacterium]